MAALTVSELFKYDWRVEIFLRKYEDNEDFTLVGGRKVKLVADKDIITAIKKQDKTTLNKLGLIDTKGNRYSFGKLEKTSEFGGKGAGAGTAKEDKELASLQKQIDDLKKKLASATVPIKVGTKVYRAAGADSTFGTPKSDFHLVDNDGKEIVWI